MSDYRLYQSARNTLRVLSLGAMVGFTLAVGVAVTVLLGVA